MGIVNDYRISQIVVLCKDCGQDVGLYPARHKCEVPERPPLPTINLDEMNRREGKNIRHSPLSPIQLEKKLNQSASSSISEYIESPRQSPPSPPIDLEKKLRRNVSVNGREEATTKYSPPLTTINYDQKMRLNGSSVNRHEEITPHSPPLPVTLDQRMRRTGSTNGREETIRRPIPPINLDKRVKRNVSTNGVSRITVDANQWKCVTRSNSATTFNRHRKEQQKQPREIVDIKSTQASSSPPLHNKGIQNEEDESPSFYYDRFETDLPQKNPKRFQDKERNDMNAQKSNDSKNNKLPWLDSNNNRKNKDNSDGNSRSLWNKLTGSGKNKLQENTNRGTESHISGVLQEYNEPTSPARFIGSKDENYTGHYHSNEFDSMATTTTTIKKKPSLLEQRPSHQRHKKLWERQEAPSRRELEREALRHHQDQVAQEETVTRSQTMRQYHPRRDIVEPSTSTSSQRRHYYQEDQENYKNNQHPDDMLDSIYGNYLSDNVTRSYSERRSSPTRRMHNKNNNITPPIMGGYF
ncbi:hypothetical protein BDC45DRAFT_517124 [Circinella umbellata]|nr:hypothetical protein BDC45DRAFT_517124 [Circinella umbellata]